MKAVILSAGKGTRLQPITNTIPKVMVDIGGKPLLQYHIEWLEKNGIKEIGINLHHCPEVIKNYFGDGKKFGVNIHYSFEPELLGTGGGFKNFQGFVNNDQCLIIYGDNFFELNLEDFLEFHEEKNGLGSICVKEWEDPSSKGVVEIDKNFQIRSFVEKPSVGTIKSKVGNAGIYLVESKIFDYIKKDVFSDFGKDIFPKIILNGEKLFAYILTGYHEDIGTTETLNKVRNFQN